MTRTTMVSILAAAALAACGHHDAPAPRPEVHREPPTKAPTKVADGHAAPAAHEGTTPTPAPPSGPTPAPGGVYTTHAETGRLAHGDLTIDVLDIPGSTAGATIAARMRAALRDPDEEQRLDQGSCHPTLAVAGLASYRCVLDWQYESRGGYDVVSSTSSFTFAIADTGAVHDVEPDELLLPGTDVAGIVDEKCVANAHAQGFGTTDPCTFDTPSVGLAPEGIAFSFAPGCCSPPQPGDRPGESMEDDDGMGDSQCADADGLATWAELGKLLVPGTALTAVPDALAAATQVTHMFREYGPPADAHVQALGDALPLTDAMLLAARTGLPKVQPVGLPTSGASGARVLVPEMTDSPGRTARDQRLARTGRATADVPWTWPQDDVRYVVTGRELPLRASAHGRPAGPPLVAGTFLAVLVGDVGAQPSEVALDGWMFVVADSHTAGWLPARPTREMHADGFAVAELFLDRLASDHRDALEADVRAIALGVGNPGGPRADGRVAVVAADGATTHVGVYRATAYYDTPTVLLTLAHDGTLADLRTSQSQRGGSVDLLLLAFTLDGDAGGTEHWAVYTFPRGDTPITDARPLLELALPTGDAAARDAKVTLAMSVSHGHDFWPVVARSRAGEQHYTWDGHTLVAPAAPWLGGASNIADDAAPLR